jgi:glycosyltransferase involved in cell wall biosynthesis
MTRVAFMAVDGNSWTGGYNYLLNLVRAIAHWQNDLLRPVVFFGSAAPISVMEPFSDIEGVEVVQSREFDDSKKPSRQLRALVYGLDPEIHSLFAQFKIDCIFEVAQFYGWRSQYPTIAWFPDFQHRFLKYNFSKYEFFKREIGFRAQVLFDREIMVSSNDSKIKCEQLYPTTKGRTHVVSFAVPKSSSDNFEVARGIADKYGLPQRYVFMPNQFWIHKNHQLVIDALRILKGRGRSDIVVVASGGNVGSSKSISYQQLKEQVNLYQLSEQFRLIGFIPYDHLTPLMIASDALLNPSLFEGWSTTVEEARANGVPMILSDIQAHYEQAAGIARFFDRYSPESLASELASTPMAPPVDELALEKESDRRVSLFASSFAHVVKSAINGV